MWTLNYYDTGAQVSILSNSWPKENQINVPIWNISELLDEDELIVKTAMDTDISYVGWCLIKFQLSSWSDDIFLQVPFLVTDKCLANPRLGFNVIERIINNPTVYKFDCHEDLVREIMAAMPEVKTQNQSSDILQHPQNRPTGDRWLKFQNTTIQIIKQNCKLDISK